MEQVPPLGRTISGHIFSTAFRAPPSAGLHHLWGSASFGASTAFRAPLSLGSMIFGVPPSLGFHHLWGLHRGSSAGDAALAPVAAARSHGVAVSHRCACPCRAAGTSPWPLAATSRSHVLSRCPRPHQGGEGPHPLCCLRAIVSCHRRHLPVPCFAPAPGPVAQATAAPSQHSVNSRNHRSELIPGGEKSWK